MQNGEYEDAILWFQKADKKRRNGRACACIAYCLARLDQVQRSLDFAKIARSADFENTALLNNEGMMYLRTTLPDKADLAYAAFTRAINKLPQHKKLREPFQNRARLSISPSSDPKRVPHACEDMRIALQIGEPTGELFYNAAILACRHPKPDHQQALTYLQNALDHGFQLRTLQTSPILRAALGSRLASLDISRHPNSERAFPILSTLVDPLWDESD